MSHPGIYVRGATTALTRRTVLRKAFLAPWHPLVAQLGLWFLAKAQMKTGVAIHSAHFVVNHHHTRVTPSTDEGLPKFTRIFHGELSRALNTLLLAERYDAPGEIFDDRTTHRLRLLDAEAMASHHVYEHLNAVSAGLVARPEHMPSVSLSHRHWRSGPLRIERPPLYVDPRTNPTELPLFITPDPELYRVFDGDLDGLVHHLERLAEHGRRRVRDVRRGRPPLGAKALRRLHPWSEPTTRRETRGKPVPTYKVGARGIVGARVAKHCAAETTRFRRAHRETQVAHREGDASAVYPYGTFAARVYHGAPAESEPLPDAILVKPGPTLEEVKEELARHRTGADGPEARRAARRAARRRLTDEVAAAWDEEAEEVVEHDDIELRPRAGETEASPPSDGTAIVVRQGGSTPRPRPKAAARIVTLRDRRRGRPTKPAGSDPPA